MRCKRLAKVAAMAIALLMSTVAFNVAIQPASANLNGQPYHGSWSGTMPTYNGTPNSMFADHHYLVDATSPPGYGDPANPGTNLTVVNSAENQYGELDAVCRFYTYTTTGVNGSGGLSLSLSIHPNFKDAYKSDSSYSIAQVKFEVLRPINPDKSCIYIWDMYSDDLVDTNTLPNEVYFGDTTTNPGVLWRGPDSRSPVYDTRATCIVEWKMTPLDLSWKHQITLRATVVFAHVTYGIISRAFDYYPVSTDLNLTYNPDGEHAAPGATSQTVDYTAVLVAGGVAALVVVVAAVTMIFKKRKT